MGSETQQRVHLLEIPSGRFPLLVPSATIAEVINCGELTPLPISPAWVLGVCGWRTTALPVVSFETLLTGMLPTPGPRSRVIVFYPLRGRGEEEFFGIFSTKEPQPHIIGDASELANSPAGAVESPYVAATVRLREETLLIPDLEALRAAFYP
ncbi:MAG: chemotaxis protein CheW [Acidiferrobacterales bacterium]